MSFFRRKKQQSPKDAEKAADRFRILERMEQGGMISIDISASRVFISSTLASQFITNETNWTNFLTNISQWFEFRVSTELWERHFKDVEAKAVREAKKKYAVLSSAQIREIRINARRLVNIADVPAPNIQSFDFVITSGIVFTKESEVIVVGTYTGGKFTMAPHEESVRAIKQ